MTEAQVEQNEPVHQVFTPDPADEEGRLARRKLLAECRKRLAPIPSDELFEIPGRPHVGYMVKDYSKPDTARELSGRDAARRDAPFLFKAFETGQPRPPQPGSKRAAAPRAFTIHEYLDWTVTAPTPVAADDLDFGGFRVVTLLPRYVPAWPAPGALKAEVEALEVETETRRVKGDEAMAPPATELRQVAPALPVLQSHGTPICAATIRVGPGFLELPFYATHEAKRNKGYGRALLEAIESICRAIGVPVILLCSTDDPKTRATWRQLGFQLTSQEKLDELGVTHMDLLHMDNTVQMHKEVPSPRPWKSLMLRHGAFQQRAYYIPGLLLPDPPMLPSKAAPSKPAKKKPRKRL